MFLAKVDAGMYHGYGSRMFIRKHFQLTAITPLCPPLPRILRYPCGENKIDRGSHRGVLGYVHGPPWTCLPVPDMDLSHLTLPTCSMLFYLEYVLTEHERGTPNSNAVVMAPLKMLYGGRRGKEYRRRLARAISPRTKSLPDTVRDVRLMMQEMDYGGVTTASEAEDNGGSESDSDSDLEAASHSASGCV